MEQRGIHTHITKLLHRLCGGGKQIDSKYVTEWFRIFEIIFV